MKWFDSLKKAKDAPTKISWGHEIQHNHSTTSYRDIRPRKIINLAKGIFSSWTKEPFSSQKLLSNIRNICETMSQAFSGHRWLLIVLLIFFAYITYGLGFLIRTERNIQTLAANPLQIISSRGQELVRNMLRDYQVLGFVANNPIFPLEPLATYGEILDHGHDIITSIHSLFQFQDEFSQWRISSIEMSIFPLLDRIFPLLEDMMDEIDALQIKAQSYLSLSQQSDIEKLSTLLGTFISHQSLWYDILGKNKPTRILLLNQNSDELRAGGGFPGTAFIIEFDKWKMTRFDFYDIYAIDWQLKWYRPSPEGINQFRSREYAGMPAEFEIRDANYFPTFAESARVIDGFMQEAKLWSVDMVVGINQKFLEDIIRLVEPIRVPWIPLDLDHHNAMLVISMLVEGKKSIKEKDIPKGSVKMLGGVLFHELQKQGKMSEALWVVALDAWKGEIVMGSPRPEVQKALDDMSIFDRWRGKKWDWIYPIFTSVSRNKSDRLMERTFEIEHVNPCERIMTLSQKHWFDMTERKKIQDLAKQLDLVHKIPALLPVQWDGNNVQYLRFILPPNTKYLPEPKSNFSFLETTPLHTTIHGYETTRPGTTATLKLRYVLPEWYCEDRTEFFKQPGLRNTRFIVKKWGQTVYQTFYE